MKVKKVIGRSLLVLLCIVVVIAIIGIAQFHHRSNPKNLKQYETNNPFITGETAISAHRSGAGEFPEETLAAFRGCAENPDVQVDYFEFDLHMTADDILVLSHDATLDRVSDAAAVFGAGLIVLGIWVAVDFNSFWTEFHHLFFTNDLWLMDYATCRMIRICPLQLFNEIVVRFALIFLIPFALMLALAIWGRRRSRTK